MRIALGIEYDGGGFCGWQTQPAGGSVQDAVQTALAALAGQPIDIVCAGRTDAGVHASAQVVHFDAPVARPVSAWVRGTNTFLPPAVVVRWARPVADDFHARFCAQGRHYRYLLLNRPQRPAIWHGRAGWHHAPLDLSAMQAAACSLLGEHDFSAFRAAECQARSPIKRLRRADVSQQGDFIVFDFAAGAFLHHMVRNMVGSLVYVGLGRQAPAWIDELLAARDRRLAAPTFSAAGLYLVGVDYDPRWGLPPLADDLLAGAPAADEQRIALPRED
ncbi:tRNA pseudouridine(38-40) synthase TruA [Rhodocyclus tenuis]|uniref:tRNA pseudouridine synthase A n=2 Tax=Rhodocyclus TaxID=1064 RepID=A0A6L5JV31_RHOTE|nr:tRNA pseudouridine(38-40) synthase TruA [Rhodocyclus gracilis]MQY50474.1 tRNA pseudouridine(38-40) synthase TruA [Rhodocyclus gracilis]MRD72467.1 tRNA pseudouridine(38-40) synthase TruA [Rhodocyclus gracilis]NJA87977.1 tRNA pseudouridine(38-40) synthase TruA [Rhodocyclus gracilis]